MLSGSSQIGGSNRLYDIPSLENDGSNFQTWKFRIGTVLRLRGLMGIVGGTDKRPEPIRNADVIENQSAIDTWDRQDMEAKAQLTLTLKDEPLSGIIHSSTAADVWDKLNRRYEGKGQNTVAYLIKEIFRATLSDEMPMEPQLNGMRHKAYILKTLGEPISDSVVAHAMLLSLPDSYSTLRTILNSSPATIAGSSLSTDTVITQVLTEEKNAKLGNSQVLAGRNDMTSKWVVDSGASLHMSSHWDWFITYQKLQEPRRVWMGDERFILAIGVGQVQVVLTVNGKSLTYLIPNVYYIPELSGNLLSVSALGRCGYTLKFTKSGCQLIKSGEVIATAREEGNLYVLNAAPLTSEHTYITTRSDLDSLLCSIDISENASEVDSTIPQTALVASTNTSTGSIDTWHRRLSHIMLHSVKKLFQKNMVKGMHLTDDEAHDPTTCKACLEGKQTRAPIPKESDVQNPSDGQDDENPGLLVKGKVDGDEDNSEGDISATADSIDSKQPATDAPSPDASEESDYETANEADDPELRHVLQSTPIRSTRSTTRTATRVDKGTSYSSSSTSKAPTRAPNASAKAGSIAKSTIFPTPYPLPIPPPELRRSTRNRCAPVRDDDPMYQRSSYRRNSGVPKVKTTVEEVEDEKGPGEEKEIPEPWAMKPRKRRP
ncbi:hypothetical protein D9756_000060 [Leucocoprinus leucothites]|uniref:GAG-pre-integrase domain-containing protein n=1 Tax=Leucocoprinus leucothites TaxID=201217 RepID=A0A8H5LNA4_9AGAR|nr:hypothetical protein D9756_000060 [Leucoagaricus leucothites]